ncbi:quinon protein alcohol dehydrogenase-like superfamily, partial [Jimgerdemannia flammicorona]
MPSAKSLGLIALLVLGVTSIDAAAAPPILANTTLNPWTLWGGNLANTRFAKKETILNTTNVANIRNTRRYNTTGDTSATPTISSDGTLYIPDFAGYLYAFDVNTAKIKWKTVVSTYVPGSNSVVGDPKFVTSRSSPALTSDQHTLVIGTLNTGNGGFAYLVAVNATNGKKLWSTQLHKHAAAVITQSPLIYGNSIFVGTSSSEEIVAADVVGYKCCTFQGTFLSINLLTGAIQWTFKTLDDNKGTTGGYSGGAIWGSTPVIDKVRKTVYVTTGNNYDIPDSVTACVKATNDPVKQIACYSKNNHIDSILSLDIATGALKWSQRLTAMDAYTNACSKSHPSNPQNCPELQGDDDDFSQGAMLVSICNTTLSQLPTTSCTTKTDILIGFQKNGFIGAYNPDNGAQLWYTNSVGSTQAGGATWGSATDGLRAYLSNSNTRSKNITLTRPSPGSLTMTNGGFAAAIDLRDGHIIWQTANPTKGKNGAPVTIANNVLYWPSQDSKGHLFALDAATGKILNGNHFLGVQTNSGPAVVDGNIFLGSGYNKASTSGSFGVFAIG